jgi:hypothetical protein
MRCWWSSYRQEHPTRHSALHQRLRGNAPTGQLLKPAGPRAPIATAAGPTGWRRSIQRNHPSRRRSPTVPWSCQMADLLLPQALHDPRCPVVSDRGNPAGRRCRGRLSQRNAHHATTNLCEPSDNGTWAFTRLWPGRRSPSPTLLVSGDNVLAVEVHQDIQNSSDVSFITLATTTAATTNQPGGGVTRWRSCRRRPGSPSTISDHGQSNPHHPLRRRCEHDISGPLVGRRRRLGVAWRSPPTHRRHHQSPPMPVPPVLDPGRSPVQR